ncbi:50S ribosomal protein L3 [candidate division KSB1 bacterium]|nr:MAG: 50S ribosomal protein L3 [candidate division KSB1 bacterium 4484_219]RKY79641.1 MAG: 50S ribosomal protein L3 [candidate division KSB1 bacterium]HDI52458.1 50S ribosomal protein L3 [Bacteroidota bacterium]RKY80325.1 MAG: 50S ribosomal protein L3 [candidate division KSB1 bacterium]RKY84296.1 MAG: 50S ribosomal protein L3 [candidate division KSB1 bacterium]
MIGLIGRKLGMTRIFDEEGRHVPVTVIEAGPCYVTQIKTVDKDGYVAVQLGFREKKESRTTKPLLGHFKKANTKPTYVLQEFRDFDNWQNLKLSDEIKVDIFSPGDVVKVTGRSKGRGFAGVVKRHRFAGGPKTHGQSDRARAPGSVGQSSFPSHVLKGLRMAGRMGGKRVTVLNLKVVKVYPEQNLLLLKGAVPGAVNGYVRIVK